MCNQVLDLPVGTKFIVKKDGVPKQYEVVEVRAGMNIDTNCALCPFDGWLCDGPGDFIACSDTDRKDRNLVFFVEVPDEK